MKKNNITGWKDVFSFTLKQTLKSKAYIITYVILLLLALVSMPLINKFTSTGKINPDTPNPIEKVYVNNKTTLPDLDFSALNENKAMSHIIFETMQEDYDTVANRIETQEKTSIILTITENEGIFSLNFVKASKGTIKDTNMQSLGNAISQEFENYKINLLGVTKEQTAILNAKVDTLVSMTDVTGTPITKEDTSITFSEYWFIYGLLFIIMMVNIMASTQIATSIVTEKSTRVIEYLLTSVKPLALMVGKILAMLVSVLVQMISMVIMVYVSSKVTAKVFSSSGESLFSQFLPKDIFQSLNIINIVLCFVLIILGMIFYATLAGLAGATVSKLEELSEGLTLFTFTNMIGAYIGLGAANVLMGAGVNGFVTFSFLFPLSSPFILPGAILVGKVSMLYIAAAIVLQVLFIILLFQFVAKVYETLILHNGTKIKINELIKLSKTV